MPIGIETKKVRFLRFIIPPCCNEEGMPIGIETSD